MQENMQEKVEFGNHESLERDKARLEKLKTDAEQRQKKAKELERKIKLKERKARDHALIKAGGLLNIAKLLEVEPAVVLGGLLMVAESIKDDSPVVVNWRLKGQEMLDSRAARRRSNLQ